jgi:hypothetical protein
MSTQMRSQRLHRWPQMDSSSTARRSEILRSSAYAAIGVIAVVLIASIAFSQIRSISFVQPAQSADMTNAASLSLFGNLQQLGDDDMGVETYQLINWIGQESCSPFGSLTACAERAADAVSATE